MVSKGTPVPVYFGPPPYTRCAVKNKRMENFLNKDNTNKSSSVQDCLTSYGIQSPVGKIPEAEQSRITPSSSCVEADPFRLAPRLMRSPKQGLTVERPERARSSPPALQDSMPREELTQSKGDIMSQLGGVIKKLTEAMKLPQRLINNQIRDLLNSVTKLHERAQSEFNNAIKATRRNVLLRHAGVDSTPKRPREDEQLARKTLPKKRAIQEGMQKRPTTSKRNEGDIPTKERREDGKENDWIQVMRKTSNTKKKAVHVPRPRPDAIIISRSGNMSYSDILRAVKKEDALKELGEDVSRIRNTAKGEILLEMKKAQMTNTVSSVQIKKKSVCLNKTLPE
ncbi:uncharacterized protein LOC120780445 [Bactrocera tryoni]|uniref:uncharacterized protein LOC120780445 n=1 Tax=Bactrocera tryoni TaxID=59916 RepID=UPI001A961AB8|nr:uncharacterized protein LOC120780445 [Bactrocera tryoni]